MTTITMEKHILKRLDALEDFAKEMRAALAAPATTPEQPRPFIPWSKEAEMLESWAAQPERKPPQGDAMTTREAFETEAKKHGIKELAPAGSELPTNSADQAEVTSQGQIPAWHDAPTVPGLWMRIGRTSGDAALIRHLESDDIWYEGYRWFGPITPDSGDKK